MDPSCSTEQRYASAAPSVWRTCRSSTCSAARSAARSSTSGSSSPGAPRSTELGLTLDDVEAVRAGAGGRQRRPRPPGGLLPRLARDARHARARLRHQLRVRPVQAGLRARLAARAPRSLAVRRLPVADRAAGRGVHRADLRPDRARHGRRRAATARAGSTCRCSSACPPTCRSSATGCATVNVLRLYTAQPSDEFDMAIFNSGDYIKAVERKVVSETISKVLYPSDVVRHGRELRLMQEYFLVCCALRDIVRRHEATFGTFDNFAEKIAIQLNDTHPALAVAELMRILRRRAGDGVGPGVGDDGGGVRLHEPHAAARGARAVAGRRCSASSCRATCRSSTRSTSACSTAGPARGGPATRGACSACRSSARAATRASAWRTSRVVGSHKVNGVAAIHSDLVKSSLFPDFHAMWPERFTNKTNGITPRRWLLRANPRLASLVTARIGDTWAADLADLGTLEPWADDPATQQEFLTVKRGCKERLARLVESTTNVRARPGVALRHPGQAHPRVQAAAAERAARASTCTCGSRTARYRPRSARTSSPARRRPATRARS